MLKEYKRITLTLFISIVSKQIAMVTRVEKPFDFYQAKIENAEFPRFSLNIANMPYIFKLKLDYLLHVIGLVSMKISFFI